MRALLIVAALVGGCASTGHAPGHLTPQGFVHASFPYKVKSVDGALMPPAYALDNFNEKGDPKQKGRYFIERRFDADGDGEGEVKIPWARWDLLFVHHTSGATIWLRTLPLDSNLAEIDLAVLAHDFVDGLSGSETVTVYEADLGAGAGRRFGARIVEEHAAVVAGAPAYVVTVEVANLDQVELDAAARTARLRLVFIRPGFTFPVKRDWQHDVVVPVLLVGGLAARPEVFSDREADFEALLGRIELSSKPDAPPPAPPPPTVEHD